VLSSLPPAPCTCQNSEHGSRFTSTHRSGRHSVHDRTVEFNERSSQIWKAFGVRRVSTLRRSEIQGFIHTRAAAHPRSAKDELEFLKRALTVSELYELAARLPEHVKRLVLLAGQVGARQNVWFNLTNDLLDLRTRTLTVPAELAKNRREHRVFLTDVEANLLREQLRVRANGTRLLFPTVTGKAWTRSGFRERVWLAAIHHAAQQNERFDGFRFHWPRHTAGSLMAAFGMDPPTAERPHRALELRSPTAPAEEILRPQEPFVCTRRTSSDATSSADCSTNTKPQREISFLHPTGSGDPEQPVISST
jgi:integrase